MGYELELFLQHDIAIHWQCIVCKDIPEGKNGLVTMCTSGHIVCIGCIDPLRPPSKCYLCQVKVEHNWRGRYHPGIERFIQGLQVKCSKSDDGCKWKGLCGDIRNHEKKDCEHRIINCSLEGCKFTGLPPTVAAHEKDCGYRLMKCTRALPWLGFSTCSIQHKVNETELHATQCLMHCCSFHGAGCRVKGLKTEVTEHEAAYCAPLHAKLARLEETLKSNTLQSEEIRVKQLSNKITQEVKLRSAALDSRIHILKEQNNQIKYRGRPIKQLPSVRREVHHGHGQKHCPTVDVHIVGRDTPFEYEEHLWTEAHWDDMEIV